MSTTPTAAPQEKTAQDLLTELDAAKHAVEFCLNHVNGLVDMHGLVYWAGRVEALRARIVEVL